jgi:hypothetical protein
VRIPVEKAVIDTLPKAKVLRGDRGSDAKNSPYPASEILNGEFHF